MMLMDNQSLKLTSIQRITIWSPPLLTLKLKYGKSIRVFFSTLCMDIMEVLIHVPSLNMETISPLEEVTLLLWSGKPTLKLNKHRLSTSLMLLKINIYQKSRVQVNSKMLQVEYNNKRTWTNQKLNWNKFQNNK